MTGFNNYYSWFKTLMNIIVYMFFIFSALSGIFVFTSFLSGNIKYIAFVALTLLIALLVILLRKKVYAVYEYLVLKLKDINFYKLLGIIVALSVFLKVLYTVFFYFDSTAMGGDISIYAGLADQIVKGGLKSVEGQIYYLVGMALHLSVFKRLNIAYHVGIYLLFLTATVINYFSFTKLIGKEKAFLAIVLYLLMPSTCLLTFCITHELLGYFYFSVILFVLNLFFNSNTAKEEIIYSILLMIFVSLNGMISPMGKIWFIALPIMVVLSGISKRKRMLLTGVIVLCLFTSGYLTTKLEGNTASQSNNVEQLLIGCDLNSMGRHTDGRGKAAAKAYWASKGVELTYENIVEGEIGALKQEYLYLITHPLKLAELLINKYYVMWSGDFYAIEMAHSSGVLNNMLFIIMNVLSTSVWLFMMLLAIVFYKKEEHNIGSLNYRLILLGVVAVLLIVEVTNKYSCYLTQFIYFIALSQIGNIKGAQNE